LTRPRIKIAIIILALFIAFTPGCSSKKKDSAAKKPDMAAQQKPPSQMKSLLSDIENIIVDLGKKIEMEKKPGQQESTGQSQGSSQQAGQQGQGQSQSGQSQSGQDQSQQNQNQSENTAGSNTSSGKQMNSWQTEEKALKNIHKNWNALEPEAVKAGLGISERKSFEQALDQLTLEISQQKKKSSLMAAIELYGQYANLAQVFKTTVPADFYKSKYEIMGASAEAANGEWLKAKERLLKIKEYWNSFKVQAKIKDEKLMSQTDFSIDDLEQAINSQQIDTLMIKTEIALSNLKQLEKALSSQNNSQ